MPISLPKLLNMKRVKYSRAVIWTIFYNEMVLSEQLFIIINEY